MAVHGRRDYLVLEMTNGHLKLAMDNGKGPVVATYFPPGNDSYSLCDGQWHEIQGDPIISPRTLGV